MMPNLRPLESDSKYHRFECGKCGKPASNTYSEPTRTQMRERELCFTCNFWVEQEKKIERNYSKMVIIDGHIYGPGSRTTGNFRGMAGRRFDIEFIEPSEFAGKRITTFDLWSGSTMPEHLAERFPDTAKFLGGAEKVEMSGEIKRCWNPSDRTGETFPLPNTLDLK